MNCRFIHPGVNDKGNYSLITKPDLFSSNGAPPGGLHPLIPSNPWVCFSTPILHYVLCETVYNVCLLLIKHAQTAVTLLCITVHSHQPILVRLSQTLYHFCLCCSLFELICHSLRSLVQIKEPFERGGLKL